MFVSIWMLPSSALCDVRGFPAHVLTTHGYHWQNACRREKQREDIVHIRDEVVPFTVRVVLASKHVVLTRLIRTGPDVAPEPGSDVC